MAFLAAALPQKSQIKPFVSRSLLRSHGLLLPYSRIRISPTCSTKPSMAQFGEKLKNQAIIIKEKFLEAIPKPVKEVPWEKAENLLLERLIKLGTKALKSSFIGWFVISSLSDAFISVVTNQELMIPLGLLAGCLVCDFLRETLQEMAPDSEIQGLTGQFVGLCGFFVLVKFLSAFWGLKARAFL